MGPWHVVAVQVTHHAGQAEATEWCKERAGPTAPWDGPSFWASGTSASRGVALLFKASPQVSLVSLSVLCRRRMDISPVTQKRKKKRPLPSCQAYIRLLHNGRFIAAQGNLCGCQIMLASVYAPVERQERAPFFQHSLMPALPAGTPLALGTGAWLLNRTWFGDSQAAANQISTLACCPCNRQWGC